MNVRHLTAACLLVWGLLASDAASAQGKPSTPPPPPPPPGAADDMGDDLGRGGRMHRELAEVLYPVGLVRRYAHEIQLTDAQMNKLRDLVTAMSATVESIKWDLDSEAGKLTEMVRKAEPKGKVEQQLAKVLSLENSLKSKHLSLLLDVRDVLTLPQRQQLDKVKAEFFSSHPSMGRGMGAGRGPMGPGAGGIF